MSEDKGDWLIDAKPLYKLCADLDLDQQDMNRAFKSALSQSGNLIRREALQQLYKVAYKNGPMKNTQFLGSGIIVKVWRSGMGAKVGLFGRENIRYHKNVMKNPSYILRWVEMAQNREKLQETANITRLRQIEAIWRLGRSSDRKLMQNNAKQRIF